MKRVDHDFQAGSRPKFARFERSWKCLCWEGYSIKLEKISFF